MPLPGSHREKQLLSEVGKKKEAQFLQETKEPVHEETLSEQPKKRTRKKK